MNKRDLKKLKIDCSYVISPDRFLSMFGVECDNISKIDIHDLHYILGDHLSHAGIKQVTFDKIYTGEILLIGTPNNFKAYYRPIVYKIRLDNKIIEPVIEYKEMEKETNILNISLSQLCYLYANAEDSMEMDEYLDEIYARSKSNPNEESEPNRSKIYTYANKTRQHWSTYRR